MLKTTKIRKALASARFLSVRGGAALLVAILISALTVAAQVSSYGDKEMGPTVDKPSPLLEKISITQRLNAQLPLALNFVDDTGKQVQLGDYFGKRPAILALVYYQCPMLCSEELN